MLYNKRGELTTKQIVALTILVVSFIIILLLIFRLNLEGTTKKEICQNSVILRGKSLLPVGTTPLNCQTEYVCLSMSNSCDKLDYPEEIIKVKTKDDVYKAIADRMANCWWMFGEGKVNYVGSEAVPDFYCSICSQLYFDKSIEQIFGGKTFSQEKLYDYIVTNKMSEQGQEYDEYMYEGADFKDSNEFLIAIEDNVKDPGKAGFSDINLDKPHLILIGVYSLTSTVSWVIGGVLLGVGAVISVSLATLTIPAAIVVVGVGALGAGAAAGIAEGVDYYYSGIFIKGKSGNEYLRPVVVEKNPESFSAKNCDWIVTLS